MKLHVTNNAHQYCNPLISSTVSELSGIANRKFFELSKLETLSLTHCAFCDDCFDLSGFRNLRKFTGNGMYDEDVIALMEIAPKLEFLHVADTYFDPIVLTRAYEVASARVNNIPLHMIVDSANIREWRKPGKMPKLFKLESARAYRRRTSKKYHGYDVEL